MGIPTFTRECGPDGNTIVHLHATNGWTDVVIDGTPAPDIDGDGTADRDTGPGFHTIIWYGPATDLNGVKDPNRIIELHRVTIEVPALLDCVAAPSTTIAEPPTTPVEVATSTTLALVPSVSTTAPPAIEQGATVCTDGQETCVGVAAPPTLPATGNGGEALLVFGGVLLLGGFFATLAARFHPTAAEKRRVAERLHEVTS